MNTTTQLDEQSILTTINAITLELTKQYPNYTSSTDILTLVDNIPNFFNNFTIRFLGKPNERFMNNRNNTTGSIIYMPDGVKNKESKNTTEICINSFYLHSILPMQFNYPDYSVFIKLLFTVRKKLKTWAHIDGDEVADKSQQLIKVYLNLIYGMMDNPDSVLSVATQPNPRKYIVESSNTIILTIVEFLIKQNISILYIDTDSIHVRTEDLIDNKDKLQVLLNDILIDSISTFSIEKIGSSYYQMKKRYLYGNYNSKGLPQISSETILKDNKKYFGSKYPEFFPEYRI